MTNVVNVKDLFISFFSEKQMKEVEVCVDDIVPIYEDDSLELEDVVAVGELIAKFVEVCSDSDVGSLEFCTGAREELVDIRSQLEESAKRMRMMENYSEGKIRTFRRIRGGSRERNTLIEFIDNGILDLDKSIKDRQFYEGGY